MTDLILDNISLILLLPLWIFLIIMCGRFFSVYVNKSVIYFLTLLASFFGAGTCGLALFNVEAPIEWIYPFIQINEFSISFGLQIDKLSLIIALILFIVSFSVQLFSISYMKDEKKNYKFFALLNLFNFSMAFLLFSPNLFQFYVFWELVSIVSYLLIGFEYSSEIKSIASKRVFIINRIGDTALISAIIITSYYMYEFVQNYSFVTLSFQDLNVISTLLMAYASTPIFLLVCGLFILAAAVKSAQFPFYTWLQDAMEAKTPVSALLHSATMVVAGVYLVIRLVPFFTLNPWLTQAILIIGVITAFVCSILASIETNPKKILAYSTSANIGLMFVALGLLNIKAALFLLVAHAFIKSMLFILLPKDKNISKINLILFIIGGLSLSGTLFGGLSAKELIYSGLKMYKILPLIYMFVSFVTAFYITRLGLIVYKKSELQNQENITELISFVILLFGNISVYLVLRGTYHIEEPFAASIGGLCLAFLLYKHSALEKISTTPKIIEKLFNKYIPDLYASFVKGMDYTDNNILSNYKPILYISKICINTGNWIEVNILNRTVTTIGNISKWFSKKDMLLQGGNIQTYNAYAFIIVTVIIALVIIGYTIILN